MSRFLFLIFLAFFSLRGLAQEQDEDDEKPKKLEFNGYLKDMVTLSYIEDINYFDNLIHNRLNFKWTPNQSINVYAEIRTRVFFGELVSALQQGDIPYFPKYSELIDVNDDFFDLSGIIVDGDDIVIHTMLDRAYIEWFSGDWEIRAGRQRINWGTNLVWNPNDLFNAYSFFDFDYEERPGSDAIRIKRYTGFASSVEIASNIREDFDGMIIAALWKFNMNNYDIQLITGKSMEDLVIGTGWAGNIRKAGIKGEITWFYPYNKDNSEEAFLASVSADYSFKNSLYIHGSVLYNSNGDNDPDNAFIAIELRKLTAKELSPYSFNTFLQLSYTFHPLVSGGLATIYYPTNHDIFLNPSVTVSLTKNIDFDILGQFFYSKINSQSFFGRLKWSF